MSEVFHELFRYLFSAAAASVRQLAAALGIFFLSGFALFLLSALTRKTFHASGRVWLDRWVTGWLGTPVHELGHAVFCILFGHRITGMRLFSPVPRDGSLGYVEHAFNRKNLYHQIGNFFIGAGPIISGTLVLHLLMRWLLPGHRPDAHVMDEVRMIDCSSAGFWAFLYLSLCTSSHMGLSLSDVKGMLGGLLAIALTVFALNCAAPVLHLNPDAYARTIADAADGTTELFIWAAVISAANFLCSYVLLAALHYRKYGKLLRVL
ncbi:MAG: hypothetical protein ACM3Q4_12035 [Acidobacteriota bacterium]